MALAHLKVGIWTSLCVAISGCVSIPDFFGKGDGKVVQTESGSCVHLMPETKLHEVDACIVHDRYEVRAVGREWRMDGADFRALFRERVLQFVRTTDYPWQTLAAAEVEMWLVAPIFAPEQAYFMGAVTSAGGNFAVRLDLAPEDWRVDTDVIQWLGAERYPSRAAKKAGVVQAVAHTHVSAASLSRYVRDRNLTELRTVGGAAAVVGVEVQAAGATVRTHAFSERAVAERLATRRGAIGPIRDVSLVPAGEPEGARASVFRFPFVSR